MHWMLPLGNPGQTPTLPSAVLRRASVTITVLLLTVLCPGLSAPCFAQDSSAAREQLDWARHRTSPVDLMIDAADVLNDSKADLDSAQQQAWQELTEEVDRRRQALREEYPEDFTARWEAAFYRYADARRAAWHAGSLLVNRHQKADPFRDRDDVSESTAEEGSVDDYSLIADILDHPQEFIGKPVVFRGILKRPASVALGRLENRFPAEGTALSLGELYPLNGGTAPIAMVHTTSVERTSGSSAGIGPWPRNASRLPVLVKGWVVKLWGDQRPLIYCESVRVLSIQPAETLIRQYAVSRQPILNDEAWLYYETLASLDALDALRRDHGAVWKALFPGSQEGAADTPQLAATRFLNERLDDLLLEIAEKVQADKAELEKQRDTREISEEQYNTEINRLVYLVNHRTERFHDAKKNPAGFDTYVDLFMNPSVWQGQLVTLRGHVRHVVSYPADHPEFEGRKLHELWLYTDDSQNNPAVIVTPTLPAEFPVDAPLIDQVTVTGCVFKQYVYRSQESRRIAPLILAGSVQWAPTDSHLMALQDDGHLASGSVLAQRVHAARDQRPGGMALLLVGFLATLSIMVLWGRAQRDRRDHRNLMNRIAEKPTFESSLDGEYSPRLSDYTSGYDL